MRHETKALRCRVALLLAIASVGEAHGQSDVRSLMGLDGFMSRPAGEFRQHVGTGYGLDVNVAWRPWSRGPLSLRGDIGYLLHDRESSRLCFGAGGYCDTTLDLTTTSSVGFLTVGPQLDFEVAGLRPYAHVGIGFSHFGTRSQLEGAYSGKVIDSSQDHSHYSLSWAPGAGLLIPITPDYLINLSARYHRNGQAEYLRDQDVEHTPAGELVLGRPTRSEADFLTFQVGFSIRNPF